MKNITSPIISTDELMEIIGDENFRLRKKSSTDITSNSNVKVKLKVRKKPKIRYVYIIKKVWSRGRGKISSKKITTLPFLYPRLGFLYSNYNLKPDEKIVVYRVKKINKHNMPFEVVHNGTVKEFIEKFEKVSKISSIKHIYDKIQAINCKYCGTKIDNKHNYCYDCGRQLK